MYRDGGSEPVLLLTVQGKEFLHLTLGRSFAVGHTQHEACGDDRRVFHPTTSDLSLITHGLCHTRPCVSSLSAAGGPQLPGG